MFINYEHMLHLIRKNSVRININDPNISFFDRNTFSSVENMHKYTTEMTNENNLQRQDRNRYTLRHYFSEESSTTV